MERKLVTVREIASLTPIEGADRIELAQVDGWKVVVKKGDFEVNQSVLYFELDSFIPEHVAPFLFKGAEYLGVKGARLKTIKLRGQISQGLILPIPEEEFDFDCIVKWENVNYLPGSNGKSFPSFIYKTDQERVQNINLDSFEDGLWEVTEKLDGSSMSVFINNKLKGVCSRNQELDKSLGNQFWQAEAAQNIIEKIRSTGRNLAFQGELIGPKIQGNHYKLSIPTFYLYNIFDIDTLSYLKPTERQNLTKNLDILHVPVLLEDFRLYGMSRDTLLELAEAKSDLNPSTQREGLVFKSLSSRDQFKAISNKWLLKYE